MKNLFSSQSQKLSESQPEKKIEPVLGWRSWKRKGSRLYSLTQEVEWPVYKPLEAIDPNFHIEEELNGIHALKTLKILQESGYMNSPQYVVGTVALWGMVIEGAKGYRAQFAYPQKFLLHPNFGITEAMAMEEEYGALVEFSTLANDPLDPHKEPEAMLQLMQQIAGLGNMSYRPSARTAAALAQQQYEYQRNAALEYYMRFAPGFGSKLLP